MRSNENNPDELTTIFEKLPHKKNSPSSSSIEIKSHPHNVILHSQERNERLMCNFKTTVKDFICVTY